MIGRWGLYGDLMRELREAGFPPDQADRAARIAESSLRERRDSAIRTSHATGHSIRKLAKVWGLKKSQVHRILSPDHRGEGTPT